MQLKFRILMLVTLVTALLIGTLPTAAQGGPGTEDFPIRDFGACINLPDFTIVTEPDAYNTVYTVPGLFAIHFAEYLLPLSTMPNSGNEIYSAMITLLNTVYARDYVRVNFTHPQYISAAVNFTLDGRRMFGMIYRNQNNNVFFLFADDVTGFDMLAIGRAIFAGDRRCRRITGIVNPEYGAAPAPWTPGQAQPGQAQPNPQVSFTVNGAPSATINAGGCANIAWNTANVSAVYYQGAGVAGVGAVNECPAVTTTYTLHVVFTDGSAQDRTVTINVQGGGQAAARLDYMLQPVFGAGSPPANFLPDPWTAWINGGGPVNVQQAIGSVCSGLARGFTTSAPSYRFHYTNGGMNVLRFYFEGGSDSTMVVNDPFGNWYCDDDSHGNLQPQIRFPNPANGQYDVWIGTYSSGATVGGNLYITEYD